MAGQPPPNGEGHEPSDRVVRLALLLAVLFIVQPGSPPALALLMAAVLLATLVVSLVRRVELEVLVVLIVAGLALRLEDAGGGSDVLDVTAAAIQHVLAGGNPYGVGYEASRPPGAPFPYGPVALLWYLPFADQPRIVEMLSASAVILVLAARGRILGLAIYATLPALVRLSSDGSNDTSAGLLILAALGIAGRQPIAGAALLGVAAAFKPYALAWAPPLLIWAGLPAAGSFLIASIVAWSPVLLLWGPGAFLLSLRMADAIHSSGYYSLGAIWEGLTHEAAPAQLFDRLGLALGGLTAVAGLRFATTMDRVIVAGALTFLVTLYAGYWATIAYIAALAPIVCWRIDDWLALASRPAIPGDVAAPAES